MSRLRTVVALCNHSVTQSAAALCHRAALCGLGLRRTVAGPDFSLRGAGYAVMSFASVVRAPAGLHRQARAAVPRDLLFRVRRIGYIVLALQFAGFPVLEHAAVPAFLAHPRLRPVPPGLVPDRAREPRPARHAGPLPVLAEPRRVHAVADVPPVLGVAALRQPALAAGRRGGRGRSGRLHLDVRDRPQTRRPVRARGWPGPGSSCSPSTRGSGGASRSTTTSRPSASRSPPCWPGTWRTAAAGRGTGCCPCSPAGT